MSTVPTPNHPPDSLAPRWLAVAGAWSWPLIGVGIVSWAVLRTLGQMPVLVVSLLVALLFTVLLNPLLRGTDQLGWPRPLAAVLVVVGFLALAGAALTVVVTTVSTGLRGSRQHISEGLVRAELWLANSPLRVDAARLNALTVQAQQWVTSHVGDLGLGVWTVGSSAAEVAVGIAVCLLSTILLLADGRRLWWSTALLLPAHPRRKVTRAARAGWQALSAYVHTQTAIALMEGALVGLGAALLGVPFAAAMGLLVFITAFIPVIGVVIAGTVCVVLTLLVKSWVAALVMLAIVVVVQQVETHILQPWLMGRAVSVHPLAVIVGVTAGSMLAGIGGALFAVPLLAFGNAVLRSLLAYRLPEHSAPNTEHNRRHGPSRSHH